MRGDALKRSLSMSPNLITRKGQSIMTLSFANNYVSVFRFGSRFHLKVCGMDGLTFIKQKV